MPIDLRPFHRGNNLIQQRELFRDCFPEALGTGVDSIEHYTWKFHSIPESPPSHEFGAWDSVSHAMLGYYAALPYRYQVKAESYTCGMVCDVMTHSSARGQGVFTKMGRYVMEELKSLQVDFTSGYPIRPEVIPGHLKVGWQIALEVPMYLKLLNSSSLLSKTPACLLSPFINLGLKAYAWTTRSRSKLPANSSVTCQSVEDFLAQNKDAYTEFFRTWSSERAVYLSKDTEFLRWRLGAPGTKYEVLTIWRDLKITAVAIVRNTNLKGITCTAILDFMTIHDCKADTGILLRAIEQVATNNSSEAITIMIKRASASRLKLWRFGFLRTPFAFKLILNPLSERAKTNILPNATLFDPLWIDSDDL